MPCKAVVVAVFSSGFFRWIMQSKQHKLSRGMFTWWSVVYDNPHSIHGWPMILWRSFSSKTYYYTTVASASFTTRADCWNKKASPKRIRLIAWWDYTELYIQNGILLKGSLWHYYTFMILSEWSTSRWTEWRIVNVFCCKANTPLLNES